MISKVPFERKHGCQANPEMYCACSRAVSIVRRGECRLVHDVPRKARRMGSVLRMAGLCPRSPAGLMAERGSGLKHEYVRQLIANSSELEGESGGQVLL